MGRRASVTWALALVAVAAGAALADDEAPAAEHPTVAEDHPVHLDRTGIRWVLPFERAQAVAKERGHPLLIKAVAFGTTKSGCW